MCCSRWAGLIENVVSLSRAFRHDRTYLRPDGLCNRLTVPADHRQERGDKLPGLAAELAAPCTVEMNEMMNMAPTVFPDDLINTVEAATRNLGHPYMHLPSGAFHDAGYIAKVAPTTMIFIPCKRGVSHNEAEDATAADCAAAVDALELRRSQMEVAAHVDGAEWVDTDGATYRNIHLAAQGHCRQPAP